MSPCPHCGELIPDDAVFCRHCGSDMETGWNPDAEYESVELPEYDYDPEEAGAAHRSNLFTTMLLVIAILFVVAFAGGAVRYGGATGVLIAGAAIVAVVFAIRRRGARGP